MYNYEIHHSDGYIRNFKRIIQLKLYRLFYKLQSNSVVSIPIYKVNQISNILLNILV